MLTVIVDRCPTRLANPGAALESARRRSAAAVDAVSVHFRRNEAAIPERLAGAELAVWQDSRANSIQIEACVIKAWIDISTTGASVSMLKMDRPGHAQAPLLTKKRVISTEQAEVEVFWTVIAHAPASLQAGCHSAVSIVTDRIQVVLEDSTAFLVETARTRHG
ncbi:MAG: hypothetical protein JXR96_06855 [Deltaproteobacteria bacterium]|nr:hypothetical protein [Deltaproteobacteria bacterium]